MRYSAKHPSMRIIDSMEAIRPIMSRLSMLAPFGDHGIHLKAGPPHNTCHTWTSAPTLNYACWHLHLLMPKHWKSHDVIVCHAAAAWR